MSVEPIDEAKILLEDLIEKQANDEGLWFDAQDGGTCPEAYLQQELRKLHAAAERLLRCLSRDM